MKAEESDLRGLIEKRNFFRGDLQIAGLHAAVHQSIKQRGKDGAPIGQLSRALFARGGEGLHVARFDVVADELKAQVGRRKWGEEL